jgi:hypothetical protein
LVSWDVTAIHAKTGKSLFKESETTALVNISD